MKKLILSMALLAGLAIVSCSKDDDGGGNCVTCGAYTVSGFEMPEMQVCKGDNGNAVIEGEDTGVSYDNYITAAEVSTDCK